MAASISEPVVLAYSCHQLLLIDSIMPAALPAGTIIQFKAMYDDRKRDMVSNQGDLWVCMACWVCAGPAVPWQTLSWQCRA